MSYFIGAPLLFGRHDTVPRAFKRRVLTMTPEKRRAISVKSSLTRQTRCDTGRADAKLRKF